MFSIFIAVHTKNTIFVYIIIIYGCFRCFELIVYQVNVLLFDPYRASKVKQNYEIKSATRTVVLLFHNVVEYICWFGMFYAGTDIINGNTVKSTLRYIGESFYIFSSIDNSILFQNDGGVALIFGISEVFIGLFMSILCLARFIGMLPTVKSKDNT